MWYGLKINNALLYVECFSHEPISPSEFTQVTSNEWRLNKWNIIKIEVKEVD